MKKINLKRFLLVFVLSSFLIVTCAPQAGATQAPATQPPSTEEPSNTTQAPATTNPIDVVLMSWAEDDFEQWALDTLVERFNSTYPQYKATLRSVR